jgi:cysteine synthase
VTGFVSKDDSSIRPFINSPALELIGNTPLIELNLSVFAPFNKIRIFAKLEMFNFGGSIKDRPSLSMIEEAEKQGLLNGREIIEATSGNTGIGLAWIGRLKGYDVTLVMPDSMSRERLDILTSYGARVILTSGEEGMDGAIKKARTLAERYPKKYFLIDQFNNEANLKSHYNTTGPELWKQANNQIDHFVAGFGTGGTIMGVGRYLKEQNEGLKIIGVEPYKDSLIPGLKNMKYVQEIPKIFKKHELDKIITVTPIEAKAMTKRLAYEASLLVGPSSGAAFAGVFKYLNYTETCVEGNLVTIFPDSGHKYLSQSENFRIDSSS